MLEFLGVIFPMLRCLFFFRALLGLAGLALMGLDLLLAVFVESCLCRYRDDRRGFLLSRAGLAVAGG